MRHFFMRSSRSVAKRWTMIFAEIICRRIETAPARFRRDETSGTSGEDRTLWYNKFMPKKNRNILIGVVAVVVIVGFVWFIIKSHSAPGASNGVAQNGTSTSNTATSSNQIIAKTAPAILKRVSPPTAVLSPASSAQLVLGENNTIQWNRAANITGGIYIVNAADGSTVGWILGQTGRQQTSYSWNTRDIFAGRTVSCEKRYNARHLYHKNYV